MKKTFITSAVAAAFFALAIVAVPPAQAQTGTILAGPFVPGGATGNGNARVANVVSLGALAGLTALCDSENLERATTANAPPKYKDLNLRALHAGFELARTVIPVEETAAG